MTPRKLILDVDTGTDDAVAIMLAALHPDLDLLGCTTVNGNIEVEYCTNNTLRVLDYIGHPEIPVYEGAKEAIVRKDLPIPRKDRMSEADSHGLELPIPQPTSVKQSAHAVEYLIETYRSATEPITLVPVGPLTNIALAIKLDPGFVDRVPELVIMGGGHEISNTTAAAEFNIWVDPEAADVVFQAGFAKITLVPLEATHQALVSLDHAAQLRALGSPAGEASARFIERRIDAYDMGQPMEIPQSAPVHDALCVAYLLDPSVIELRDYHVAIETQGRHTLGRTVIDTHFRGKQAPNARVAVGSDPEKFVRILLDAFAPEH
ncbi:nucleoside hydrolase [Naasia lichenicola]|uniref:Nucleoside hydrolase n=1 Tax=Naasia lichenicola TaxID=2565933 RepID=A0A4S4FSK1_9MICO|nr:nucleoside hydrolase [Naasia lichenicola]THG33281.1 nucleoside hydrolase [Naasia lichenicola]